MEEMINIGSIDRSVSAHRPANLGMQIKSAAGVAASTSRPSTDLTESEIGRTTYAQNPIKSDRKQKLGEHDRVVGDDRPRGLRADDEVQWDAKGPRTTWAGDLHGAERVGFEPTDELPRHLLSREARSTGLWHLSMLRPRPYNSGDRAFPLTSIQLVMPHTADHRPMCRDCLRWRAERWQSGRMHRS